MTYIPPKAIQPQVGEKGVSEQSTRRFSKEGNGNGTEDKDLLIQTLYAQIVSPEAR